MRVSAVEIKLQLTRTDNEKQGPGNATAGGARKDVGNHLGLCKPSLFLSVD